MWSAPPGGGHAAISGCVKLTGQHPCTNPPNLLNVGGYHGYQHRLAPNCARRAQLGAEHQCGRYRGNVHWQFQKSSAYEAVHDLVGVRGITNLITVTPKVRATEVKSRIEAAFRRSAEVDALKVQVETHNSTVTLRGDVRSWSERQEAERTAWAAPGVTQVENLIMIKP